MLITHLILEENWKLNARCKERDLFFCLWAKLTSKHTGAVRKGQRGCGPRLHAFGSQQTRSSREKKEKHEKRFFDSKR